MQESANRHLLHPLVSPEHRAHQVRWATHGTAAAFHQTKLRCNIPYSTPPDDNYPALEADPRPSYRTLFNHANFHNHRLSPRTPKVCRRRPKKSYTLGMFVILITTNGSVSVSCVPARSYRTRSKGSMSAAILAIVLVLVLALALALGVALVLFLLAALPAVVVPVPGPVPDPVPCPVPDPAPSATPPPPAVPDIPPLPFRDLSRLQPASSSYNQKPPPPPRPP